MAQTNTMGSKPHSRTRQGFIDSIKEELGNARGGDFKQTLDHLFHAIGDHVRKDPYGAMREAATFGASLAAINPNQLRSEVTRFVKELFQPNVKRNEDREDEHQHQS
jgi:hypothetical protein